MGASTGNRSDRWARECCSLSQTLAHEEPGGAAMGQEVVGLVEQFEGGSGSEARTVGPDRKGGQDLAEGFDAIDHEADGNIGQRGSFGCRTRRCGKATGTASAAAPRT